MMAQYDTYAKFYDSIQQKPKVDSYRHLLSEYHPAARSLLEIGCGTGAVLEELACSYAVEGLDLSRGMLRVARRRLPGTTFHNQDMTGFDVGRKFDAVICPFGGIGHLTSGNGAWTRTFKAVRRHLNAGGIFIFDTNSEYQLAKLCTQPPFVREFDGGVVIMRITAERRGVTMWEISIFEQQRGSTYRLHRDDIGSIAYPLVRIKESLTREFRTVRVFDGDDWRRPKKTSPNLCFVCRV